ncbi:MAG TPA: fused MFS/spermidine synthase [Bryobacteraceae bacterium]|nr:fused MFS/spermidine synthase [Bryobacteraceae bacterium]
MAKAMLPWFGGSAGVWASAMLFFQVALLLGYLYAHWTTQYLHPRQQVALHLLLLAGSLFVLPIALSPAWKPDGAADPIPRILGLLATSAGLPYFLLCTTGPLIQAWYARRVKAAFPYRLFAVSNVASLAALIAYPVAIEPLVSTGRQLRGWSAAYAGFVLLAGASGLLSAGRGVPAPVRGDSEAPPISDRLLWITLAACPSILWMAVANTLSQSVAPVPFLWILPLSIYLVSFILCFNGDGWYRPAIFRIALPAAWIAICLALNIALELKTIVALLSFALFVCCMACHGELAHRKPRTEQLTSFYLSLAAGGAAGGLFVALIAPNVFSGYLELPIGVAVCVILSMGLLYGWGGRRLARLGIVAVLALVAALRIGGLAEGSLVRVRNFYGTLQVGDVGSGAAALRILTNGPIRHGSQFLAPDKRRMATTYFGPDSGIGVVLRAMEERPLRVGVIGLGAGTIASYGRAGDYFRFYELNPAVIRVADGAFSYLRDSPATVEVAPGDARLSLERERKQDFDVLAVDAFSGDSIPIHLLTREAFRVYFSHLKPDGALAVHVTNRYLDLTGVVRALAEDAGKPSRLIVNAADAGKGTYDATWVVATSNEAVLRRVDAVAVAFSGKRVRAWTDEYSDLWGVLR